MLKNDLRNIARVAGINGTSVIDGIGKMDKSMHHYRITMGKMSL